MNKKYELTNETIEFNGHTLRRIRYADGTKGGWLESYGNLSQEGESRVLDNAKAYDNGKVCDNARIYDDTQVYGNGQISGNASAYGCTGILGNAQVYDNAEVYDACVTDFAKAYGSIKIVRGWIDYDFNIREAKEAVEREAQLERARAEEAKKAPGRQEVMEEILLMIKHCPPGQKDQLMPRIASLLLAVDSSDRDKIIELYTKWYDKVRVGFAPSPSGIKEEIRRIERSGESTSQTDRTPSYPSLGGGYNSSPTGLAYSAAEDYRRMREFEQNRNLYRTFNPPSGGEEWGD